MKRYDNHKVKLQIYEGKAKPLLIFLFLQHYSAVQLSSEYSVKNKAKLRLWELNQFTYDYVKLKIGYFSNRIPVWEGIFTLENLT